MEEQKRYLPEKRVVIPAKYSLNKVILFYAGDLEESSLRSNTHLSATVLDVHIIPGGYVHLNTTAGLLKPVRENRVYNIDPRTPEDDKGIRHGQNSNRKTINGIGID